MKFKSYIGKRVHVSPGKEVVFGAEEYETEDEKEIEALKYALEVLEVGGDGTDGSGRKIKLSKNHTLEPESSPESDSLLVTENSSDADLLAQELKDDGRETVVKSDSTQAVNEAKQAAKYSNNGKLNTEQSNAIEEFSKNPKK